MVPPQPPSPPCYSFPITRAHEQGPGLHSCCYCFVSCHCYTAVKASSWDAMRVSCILPNHSVSARLRIAHVSLGLRTHLHPGEKLPAAVQPHELHTLRCTAL